MAQHGGIATENMRYGDVKNTVRGEIAAETNVLDVFDSLELSWFGL
jgi:hypothetical protein